MYANFHIVYQTTIIHCKAAQPVQVSVCMFVCQRRLILCHDLIAFMHSYVCTYLLIDTVCVLICMYLSYAHILYLIVYTFDCEHGCCSKSIDSIVCTKKKKNKEKKNYANLYLNVVACCCYCCGYLCHHRHVS